MVLQIITYGDNILEMFDAMSAEPLDELWNRFEHQTTEFADFIVRQEKIRLRFFLDKANENFKQIFKDNQSMVCPCSLL